MTFIHRKNILALSAAATLMLGGCASSESAKKDDSTAPQTTEKQENTPVGPAERPAENTPAAASPAEPAPAAAPPPEEAPPPAAEPAAEPEPKLGDADLRRSKDGIDDDTPLPAPGSGARDAFDQATAQVRTNPSAAADAFAAAGTKTKYFYAAYFNAGTAAEAAGDATRAERYYKEALNVRPDYGYALTNLYLLLRNLGRTAEGDQVIDGALSKHGDKAGPHVAAAMRHYVNRRRADVKTEALNAIRIDERQVPAMQLMAAVFYEERRYETARFALENALRLEPGNALLHLELGHVLLQLDEEKRAMNEFKIALTLRDDVAEAHENFAILALSSGDSAAAATSFKRAAELKPRSAQAQMHLGNGLRATKKYAESLAAYQKALELNPNLHQVHFNLAIMHLDNELPGLDYLARLEKAKAEFGTFRERGNVTDDLQARIEDYEKTLDKRIRREKKRIKRAAERAGEEAAKAQEPPPPEEPAPEAGAEPAADGAPAETSPEGTPEGNPTAALRVDNVDMEDAK